jgi:hypothetical protein
VMFGRAARLARWAHCSAMTSALPASRYRLSWSMMNITCGGSFLPSTRYCRSMRPASRTLVISSAASGEVSRIALAYASVCTRPCKTLGDHARRLAALSSNSGQLRNPGGAHSRLSWWYSRSRVGCAARSHLSGPFLRSLPPNPACTFQCTGLSSDLCRSRDRVRMDIVMACSADDKCFAAHFRHEHCPCGLAWSWSAEFCKPGDLVNCHRAA